MLPKREWTRGVSFGSFDRNEGTFSDRNGNDTRSSLLLVAASGFYVRDWLRYDIDSVLRKTRRASGLAGFSRKLRLGRVSARRYWIFQDESVVFSILFHAGDAYALRKQRRLIKLQEILPGMKFTGRVIGIVSGRTIPKAFCFWAFGLNKCDMFGNERIGNTNDKRVVCVFLKIIL